eukprot:5570848-Prymnesium_polylepis.1
MRSGPDQSIYAADAAPRSAACEAVAAAAERAACVLRSYAAAVVDGSAPTLAPTLPNPASPGPPLELQDLLPMPRPRRTLRECHVHKCDSGQYDPSVSVTMGTVEAHGTSLPEVEHHQSGALSSADFYAKFIAANVPVVIDGESAAARHGVEWDDAFFLERCKLPRGDKWYTLVEVNKVVIRNDRYPLMESFTMCDFIENYSKPEYSDQLYTITPLNHNDNLLRSALAVPPVMRCVDLWETVHEARLWMSSGNTSSSLHFDTHENLLMQMDGTKTIYLWPPSESKNFYMDYHDRWGLSPLHVDRVDLS